MKAVFLDRDGVINKYPGDNGYVKFWEEFHFLPGVKEALRALAERGYALFIISNQAGVAKGLYSQEALDLITGNMLDEFKKAGVGISGVYYCTHRPEDNCSCRKPKTGMLHAAIEKAKGTGKEINLGESYFIGDTIRDIQTGKSLGLKTVLVFSGKEKEQNKPYWECGPDFTSQDLRQAVEEIIQC